MTRLLLVEDDPTIASAVHEGLAADGYVVDVAANGVDAPIALDPERFDLAAVDPRSSILVPRCLLRRWRTRASITFSKSLWRRVQQRLDGLA